MPTFHCLMTIILSNSLDKCVSVKLAIELDGQQHYTKEGMTYDTERSAVLAGYGIKVVRFRNQDVINDFNRICKQIADLL
ncbi:MAG: endonuclease domain-containing protein [Aphanocapsa sp. GSE-SYN-MK-11-07L]|jgi:very-short-patch-repair endonuclease|nr:endonuclease domain-containing protein [Aphanocapsa sp. GSE-SYN-MK-11-07L]